MARYHAHHKGDRDEIYDAVTNWENECLLNDGSLIWSGESIWTKDNMNRFREVFIEDPDISRDSFDNKLKRQLENESEGVYKFVIELLYVYYLFPREKSIRYSTKMSKMAMVASWKEIDLDQSLSVFNVLKDGLGLTGVFFNTQKYYEISFLFLVVEKIKREEKEERKEILKERKKLKCITELARKEIGKRAQSQHIILHLILPEYFERISSGAAKTKIVKSYADMLTKSLTDDIDEQLFIIREKIERKYPNKIIDFYTSPAIDRWVPTGEPNGIDFNNVELAFDGLIFENEELLVNQITTALKNGKNIIFTGPPGTGKSKLASVVCDAYKVKHTMVTASSNWSTFDTIGGYMPNREGELYFSEGIFLKCFKDKSTGQSTNKWLIIDEINRADIDKAFGSLFSVLTGDKVALPFETKNGKTIQLIPQDKEEPDTVEDHIYVIPENWRMIGTMNTVDKASLYEMSYAFMRRFAFIPVGIPKHITEEVVKQYLTVWGLETHPLITQLTTIWKLINEYRKIGPAIVEDLANYTMDDHEDFTSAIILNVLPQFEGLSSQRITEFIERFRDETDIVIDFDTLKDFVEDFFEAGLFE